MYEMPTDRPGRFNAQWEMRASWNRSFRLTGFYGPLQQMCAGAVVQNNLFESNDQAAGIASLANLVEGIKPALDISLRHAVTHEDADLFVFGWNCVLKK